jgi:hypothetical protein
MILATLQDAMREVQFAIIDHPQKFVVVFDHDLAPFRIGFDGKSIQLAGKLLWMTHSKGNAKRIAAQLNSQTTINKIIAMRVADWGAQRIAKLQAMHDELNAKTLA